LSGTTFIATGSGSKTVGCEGLHAVPACPSGTRGKGKALGIEEFKLTFCSYMEKKMG